jgi:hypothetical protein
MEFGILYMKKELFALLNYLQGTCKGCGGLPTSKSKNIAPLVE